MNQNGLVERIRERCAEAWPDVPFDQLSLRQRLSAGEIGVDLESGPISDPGLGSRYFRAFLFEKSEPVTLAQHRAIVKALGIGDVFVMNNGWHLRVDVFDRERTDKAVWCPACPYWL